MAFSKFPNGFKNGVAIRGLPLAVTHPGEVFWVNNSGVLAKNGVGGSDNHQGTYHQPLATIDAAVGKCSAGRGDIIMVMPGHVETIGAAAALDLDVAGVAVIGLGRGAAQPRLDFTDTAGTVEVNADDVSIVNMNFHANVPAVVIGLSVLTLATDLLVQDCVFDTETAGTDEFLIAVNVGVGCDRLQIADCKIDMGIGAANHAIKLVGATDDVDIRHNRIRGDYAVANIGGITTLSTNLDINGNLLENGVGGNLNAQPVVELLTGTTGTIRDNYCVCNVATAAAAMVSDTCLHFQNKYNETISTTGINLEVADV